MKRVRSLAAIGLSMMLMGVGAAPASAAGTPDGCTSSGLNFQFANDPDSNDVLHIHRVGDQMQIGVNIANNSAGACSVDGATVTVQVPATDGTPGAITTIATNASFPGGMASAELPTKAPYTFAFDPTVFRGPVTISVSGTGHFPGGDSPTTSSLTTTVVVSKPHAMLTMTASTGGGPVPLAVTYMYTLLNDSPVDPDSPTTTPTLVPSSASALPDGSAVSDDTCTPLTYTGGDTHLSTPSEINPGETWTFSCMHTFDDLGTFTSHASVAGTSTRDGRAWSAATALSTVTATASDLTITKAHSGDFMQGDSGRPYTIVVKNSGNDATTSATATVTDTLPAGLTATAISGTGWSCTLSSLTCTRSDPLAAGASYPAITVTTDVAAGAPATVTNTASVSGGGEHNTTNDTASDPTTINPIPVAIVTTPGTLVAAAPPSPFGNPLPSNRFSLKRVKASRKGTAVFSLTSPGAGVFTLVATATQPHGAAATVKVGTVKATAKAAGPVSLTLKPSSKAKKILKRKHKLKTRVTITFTPVGGVPSTQHKSVTLLLPARHAG